MAYLTEDDVRSRCSKSGGALLLAPGERMTPSAAELAARMGVRVMEESDALRSCASCSGSCAAPAPAADRACSGSCGGACAAKTASRPPENQDMTHLDAATVAPKSHPRIVLRGKLDTLLSAVVLTQTRFDRQDRLPAFLKTCLADIKVWVMQVLTAEVAGDALAIPGMGGMDPETLRAVSHDPERYLGVGPYCPDASLGREAAQLNWLRAVTRETEVAAVQAGLGRADIAAALNRLSSAVYVLLLLTLAAEKGVAIPQLKK